MVSVPFLCSEKIPGVWGLAPIKGLVWGLAPIKGLAWVLAPNKGLAWGLAAKTPCAVRQDASLHLFKEGARP